MFSHPGVALSDHLKGVAEEAQRLLDHPGLRDRERLRTLAYLVGVAHDFGKSTTYFQRHLNGEKVRGGLHYHSLISALFAAHLAQKRFPHDPNAWLIAYLVVHRHHGALYMPDRTWVRGDDRDRLEAQWKDLMAQKERVRHLYQKVWPYADEGFLDLSFSEVVDGLLRKLKHTYRRLSRSIPRCEDEPEALWDHQAVVALHTQLIFSALISADKFAASGTERPERVRDLPVDLVDRYVRSLKRNLGPLHEVREQFQEGVRRKVEGSDIPGIFTITAPTGTGKTLAAFRAALQVRERLMGWWGIPPRIIYALPYINLIEQVENTLHKVLDNHPIYARSPHRLLISHHHLARVHYRDEEEERPLREALLLVEDWESEVVVTTFLQVFHTFFGYENRFLKKLHNLIGGILILDEPQQFPVAFWEALGWMISLLHKEMGITMIQMTATQPRILDRVHSCELTDPTIRQRLDLHLNRYEVRYLQGEEDLEAMLKREMGEGRRVLIVVNTVGTSLKLWKRYQKVEGKRFYLSTNILPLHRRERIKAIQRALQEGEPLLVIATQVVEAGVDLDFDTVFREISPLDSLIQAAGRCNREGRQEKGRVYLFKISESFRRGGLVYGSVAMDVAQEVLQGLRDDDVWDEVKLRMRLAAYYDLLLRRGSQERSWCLWERYARLGFYDPRGLEESLKDYPLIVSRGEIPVLVMLSEQDEDLLEHFRQEVLEEREDIGKRQEAYLRYRTWLHEHTLRILEARLRRNLPPEWEGMGFRWIPYRQLEDYYDLMTGFRWKEEDLEGEVWVL